MTVTSTGFSLVSDQIRLDIEELGLDLTASRSTESSGIRQGIKLDNTLLNDKMKSYELIYVVVLLAVSDITCGSGQLHGVSHFANGEPWAAAYISMTNCWVNSSTGGGAYSELDFFYQYPIDFGHLQPDYSSLVLVDANYQWENGGVASDQNDTPFTWIIEHPNASAHQTVGFAITGSGANYTIERGDSRILYVNGSFNCRASYYATPNTIEHSITANSTAARASVGGTTTDLPVEAKIGIALGTAVAIVLFVTLSTLVVQCARRREKAESKTLKPVELGIGKTKTLSRSTTATSSWIRRWELHNQHMIEMAGADQQLRQEIGYGKGYYGGHLLSPVEIYTGGQHKSWHSKDSPSSQGSWATSEKTIQ